MKNADRSGPRSFNLKGTAFVLRFALGAMCGLWLVTAAHAQHGGEQISGTWHVAVPGWGIEDHLLVLEEHHGTVTGKFEFADVTGMLNGQRVTFDVTDRGRLVLHFDGTMSHDGMKGKVTSPEDGPLVQHGVAPPLSTEWTARREARAN
jgi:hypothetical protein